MVLLLHINIIEKYKVTSGPPLVVPFTDPLQTLN